MPLLDTALAFALTMLVVATAVTQVVRLMLKLAKTRKSQMQEMLEKFVSNEFKPVVERELLRLNKSIPKEVAEGLNKKVAGFTKAALSQETDQSDQIDLTKLTELSIDELTERLKRSDLGKNLLSELGDKAQNVFDELIRRYEIVGDRFTESFRKKSRNWSTVVAFFLALAFNIDSIHIAHSYLRDPGLRQSVIAQRDAFVEDYDALVASLEDDTHKDSVTKEELEQAFSDSRKQLDVLTSVGFPAGWAYFPHSGFRENNPADFTNRNNVAGWLKWILGVALTGVLAGLGAPFWFDAATGISRVAQRARTGKKLAKQ